MATIGDGKLISRDFRVYFTAVKAGDAVWDAVVSESDTLAKYMKKFETPASGYTLDALLATTDGDEAGGDTVWQEFGELRKDGYVSNLEDGETVPGNTKGEILISQTGSLTCTMISLNTGTLEELTAHDGDDICILAVSEDDSVLGFFYPDCRLNFNPSVTGGEVGTIEVNFNKDVACGDDWSTAFTTSAS